MQDSTIALFRIANPIAMKLSLLVLSVLFSAGLVAFSAATCPTDYTIAVLSDVHIGENADCVRP